MKARVLIVDDEPDLVKMADDLLKAEGFLTARAHSGLQALKKLKESLPDVVLMDVRMPEMDGLETLKRLRADPRCKDIPVIIVSTKSGEADVVLGLELGADDYVRKPYIDSELLARIKAVLRRRSFISSPKKLSAGPIEVDFENRTVTVAGKKVTLPKMEFELLGFLMKNQGKVLSRASISEEAWEREHLPTSRFVDYHVDQLRKLLGPLHRDHIKSLRGIGYRFEVDP